MSVAAITMALHTVAMHSAAPASERASGPSVEDVRRIEQDARAERKERLTTGALKVTAGGLQTALGLYVLLGVPHGENAVQISGILNTAAGAGFILDGTLALARRGPLEAMVRDPEFARVTMSSEGEDWLDRRLAAAARRGRIERQVAGSLSLVAGLTIVGLGVANLIQQDENQPARAVLGATEVAAGLGFSAAGVRSLVVPSDAEHALVAWKGRGNTSVVSVRIGPTLGGIRVSGKF